MMQGIVLPMGGKERPYDWKAKVCQYFYTNWKVALSILRAFAVNMKLNTQHSIAQESVRISVLWLRFNGSSTQPLPTQSWPQKLPRNWKLQCIGASIRTRSELHDSPRRMIPLYIGRHFWMWLLRRWGLCQNVVTRLHLMHSRIQRQTFQHPAAFTATLLTSSGSCNGFPGAKEQSASTAQKRARSRNREINKLSANNAHRAIITPTPKDAILYLEERPICNYDRWIYVNYSQSRNRPRTQA